ncbi:MAG TPA: hypothetical protein VNO70_13170 [Blastocatellia bacterium]|nr:hypothetical protein [Blastocatellia bacterium]
MKPIALVVTVLSLVAFGLSRVALSGFAVLSQKDKEIATQRAKEVATPIQEGVITEQQREHSKLYKEFRTDKNIRDLAATGTGDIEVQKIVFPSMGGEFRAPSHVIHILTPSSKGLLMMQML